MPIPFIRFPSASVSGTVYLGYTLDNAVAYSKNRDGTSYAVTPSGVEDAWVTGTDHMLEGDWRWIPKTQTTSPIQTGWNDSTGVRYFLEYARQKNTFRWYLDANNLIGENTTLAVDANSDGVADGWTVSTSAFATFSIESGSQKLVVNPSTSSTYFPGIRQNVYGIIPGQTYTHAADFKVSGLSGGAAASLITHWVDITGSSFAQVSKALSTGGSSFARFYVVGTAPAGTAYAHSYLSLSVPSGSSGAVWIANAQMLPGSSSATPSFVSSSYYTMYLEGPLTDVPSLENDGTRKLHLTMRTADDTPIVDY